MKWDIKENSFNIISLNNLFMIVMLTASYYLLAKFALLLNPVDLNVGLFWPASGVAVFFVLHYGLKVLPGVFIGQFLLLIDLNHIPLGLSHIQGMFLLTAQAINVTFFIFLSHFMILRFTNYQGDILDKTNLPRLILVAPISSFLPMLLSIYLLNSFDFIPNKSIILSGLAWWIGDSAGIAICLPVLLLVFNKKVTASQKITVLGAVSILLMATIYMFKHAETKQTQYQENILAHRGKEIALEINNKIQHYRHSAMHLRAYFKKGLPLSLQGFNQFSRLLLEENSSVNHLEWGVFVENKHREFFEKNLQELYKDDYQIKNITALTGLKTADLKSHYYPVKFVYPFIQNKTALGIDRSVQQSDLNSLLIAIDSGEETLDYPLQNLDFQDGYITLYTPFYFVKNNPSHSEKQFAGYLNQVINLNTFFEGIVNNHLFQHIKLTITDSSDQDSPTLYKNKNNVAMKVKVIHSFQVANKLWVVRLEANNNFLSNHKISTAWYILIAGLVITLFIILVFLTLIRKQQHIQQLVDNKKEIVKESLSHQSLLSATFNTHQAILITDPEYNIIRVNQAFCDIMGYTEVEVVGENPRIFSSGRQSIDFYKGMWSKLLGTGRYEGEIWNRRKNGEIFPEYQTITEIKNDQGEILYYISVFSDITKLKQNEEKIRHQAFYDQLTLLPNKMLFLDRLDQEVAYAQRFDGIGALLLIDIDNFKLINDTLGHHFGDDVLIELGHRLAAILRGTDTVAHLGGDDFIVFMPVDKEREADAEQHATLVAEKIMAEFKKPFFIKDKNYDLTASLGISFIKKNLCTSSDILRQAETALFKAKMAGKKCFCFFQNES